MAPKQTSRSNSTGDQYSKNTKHLPITRGRGDLKSGLGTRLCTKSRFDLYTIKFMTRLQLGIELDHVELDTSMKLES